MCIFRFQLQLDEAPLDTWVARRIVTAEMDTQADDRALSKVPLGNYSACAVAGQHPTPQCRSAAKALSLRSTTVIQGVIPAGAGLCLSAGTSGTQAFWERCQKAHANMQTLQEDGSL